MTNYSRTTLRELKKRYLNILKKCLLANLLVFSFVLPSMAETVTNPTTNEELLEALVDPTKRVEITNSDAVYEINLGDKIYSSTITTGEGGIISNAGTINFNGPTNVASILSLTSKYKASLINISDGLAFDSNLAATFIVSPIAV